MKTIRGFINLPHLLLAGFFFAGCYTQMQSVSNGGSDRRNGDRDDYAYSDSTSDRNSGGSAVDNYFDDDGYRSMRYRMSFHYYYPTRHLWMASIWFDPWYDDFYAYPWDPWYRPGLWYPTIAYPYPYWYPGWGYYPHYGPIYGYGNWRGNNYPLYGTTVEPGRRRTTGSTRGDDGGVRTRGGVTAPTTIPVTSSATSERTRTVAVPDAAPATTNADRSARRRTRDDVPWWERMKTQNPPERSRATERARVADDKAPAVDRKRVEERAKNQNDKDKPQARQRDKRAQPSQSRSVDRERRNREPSVRQAPRQETPRYSPPTRESGRSRSGNDGGNRSSGGERTRRGEK